MLQLTEFHGVPRPDRTFNLLYLEQNEFLVSSVHSRLSSAEFETESGKLHLCTRSIVFQPQNPHLPLLKFKLSNPDFAYSFSHLAPATDPRKQRTSSTQHQSPKRPKSSASLQHSLEARSALHVTVQRFTVVPRYPAGPHFTERTQDRLSFELAAGDLTRVATELEMLQRAEDEREVAQIIFGLRYSELSNLLADTDDFDPEEFLLQHKTQRLLPEGLQLGAFVLTQSSFHFYPLVNAKPSEQLHIHFRSICFALRFRYLYRQVGLRVHIHSGRWPIVLLFESEEQRENIYSFLQNRVKFRNPAEELPRFTEQWTQGRLSNFQYLMLLNNLAGRCTLDFSQYPVFPWVVAQYHGEELDLTDPHAFRDLSKPVGALSAERLARLKVRSKQSRQGELYVTHFSTPTSVGYLLIRKVPELLVRLQNGVFGPPERFFKSVEASWVSCLTHNADYRELIPEFYSMQTDFLLNTEGMDLGPEEMVSDTELPLWARDAAHFCEVLRQALESDFVSASLHHWIDLMFGWLRGSAEANNLFADSCYELSPCSSPLELEAYEALARDFGQCPTQLFLQSHPQRRFRFLTAPAESLPSSLDEAEVLQERVFELQRQLAHITGQHEAAIKAREAAHSRTCEDLRRSHELELKAYSDTLLAYESKRKLRMAGLTRTSTVELKPRKFTKATHTESSTPLSTSRKGRTKSTTPPKPRPASTLTLYPR